MMEKKYTIERNLILNEVKEGAAEDRVMVIDENNEVGSVPRSEFGGGGSVPTFQQVMEQGSSYNKSETNYSVEVSVGGEDVVIGSVRKVTDTSTPVENSFLNISPERFVLGFFRVSGQKGFEIGRTDTDAEDEFGITAVSGSFRSKIRFKDPFGLTSNTRFEVASNKPEGTYTLATLDDIPTGLTQSITIGANTFTFTNGVLTDFETVESSTGDQV